MSRETDIDRLYGLEPVFEPGEETGSDGFEQFAEVACPYCSEVVLLRLDLTGGAQGYVEDCQVCCQPMQVELRAAAGRLEALSVERSDR